MNGARGSTSWLGTSRLGRGPGAPGDPQADHRPRLLVIAIDSQRGGRVATWSVALDGQVRPGAETADFSLDVSPGRLALRHGLHRGGAGAARGDPAHGRAGLPVRGHRYGREMTAMSGIISGVALDPGHLVRRQRPGPRTGCAHLVAGGMTLTPAEPRSLRYAILGGGGSVTDEYYVPALRLLGGFDQATVVDPSQASLDAAGGAISRTWPCASAAPGGGPSRTGGRDGDRRRAQRAACARQRSLALESGRACALREAARPHRGCLALV